MNHLELRETIKWGSYGKNGDEPLKMTLIKNLSNNHINSIIPYMRNLESHYSNTLYELMVSEKEFREKNGIYVRDYDQKLGSFIKGKK